MGSGKVKVALIAGPSSSGKTTTSKKLAIQLKVLGLDPVTISLDDYFINRDRTPKDENGEYDFECLEALDVEYLNSQLLALFAGEEIELPSYDFKSGSAARIRASSSASASAASSSWRASTASTTSSPPA